MGKVGKNKEKGKSGLKWGKVVKNGQKCAKSGKKGPKSGEKWQKVGNMGEKCEKLEKVVKSGEKW